MTNSNGDRAQALGGNQSESKRDGETPKDAEGYVLVFGKTRRPSCRSSASGGVQPLAENSILANFQA